MFLEAGVVDHGYNPSILGAHGWVGHLRSEVQHQPSQHDETPSVLKISQVWWQVPIIPAPQVAEAGELL